MININILIIVDMVISEHIIVIKLYILQNDIIIRNVHNILSKKS